METLESKQAREIASLAAEVKSLKNEIRSLEEQKYEAYKRIGELTSQKPRRTAS